MRRKGDTAVLTISFRFFSSPLLWLFLPQWGELVELGLRNLSVRFSNISGYNMVYYVLSFWGILKKFWLNLRRGGDYWLFFRLRAKSIFIQLCKLLILT